MIVGRSHPTDYRWHIGQETRADVVEQGRVEGSVVVRAHDEADEGVGDHGDGDG